MKQEFRNIDEYIAALPEKAKEKITQLRQLIIETAPEAKEVISYQMPALKYYGMLVYYAAFTNHYSLFIMPQAIETFKDKLKPYKLSKGTIQFTYDQPLPVKLIEELIKFKLKANLNKALIKEVMKKSK